MVGGMSVRILTGHVLARLAELGDESVHCVVTSPPYFGLRDYGIAAQVWGGDADCAHEFETEKIATEIGKGNWAQGVNGRGEEQDGGADAKRRPLAATAERGACARCGAWRGSLGLEPTIELYIEHMVAVFREVRRVLRKDGTLWLNIGDSYAGSWGAQGRRESESDDPSWHGAQIRNHPKRGSHTGAIRAAGLKPKDLMMVPARAALALQADGWWLRKDIIWHKPNPMPESCIDRPTSAHEHVFLLAKSERYFFDQDAVRVAASPNTHARVSMKMPDGWDTGAGAHGAFHREGREKGKIPRPKAAEPASGIRANSSFENATSAAVLPDRNIRDVWTIATAPFPQAHFATFPPALVEPCIKAGCPAGGMVLDPFLGSGTVALVAARLGRDCIGIELNPDYAAMADARLRADLQSVAGEPPAHAPGLPLFAANA